MSARSDSGSRLRVIAWPAYRNRESNPYNHLLYSAVERLGVEVVEFRVGRLVKERFDVWHMHWPDGVGVAAVRLAAFVALLVIAKIKRISIVWTIHNLSPHDGDHRVMRRGVLTVLARMLDGYISLSEAARQEALRSLPTLCAKLGFVIPHGHYRGVYPDSVTREEARRALAVGQGALVLLCLGQIRPYRNIPKLLRAFSDSREEHAILLVAGACRDPDLRRGIEALAAQDERVRLNLNFVPADRIQYFLRAADVVIQPFQQILNSGSALLALSFDRPVVVPARGSLVDLQKEFGPRWVLCYDGDMTADVIESAIREARPRSAEDLRRLRVALSEIDWPRIAELTVSAYNTVAHHRDKEASSELDAGARARKSK